LIGIPHHFHNFNRRFLVRLRAAEDEGGSEGRSEEEGECEGRSEKAKLKAVTPRERSSSVMHG
jgi:hypothetical protein